VSPSVLPDVAGAAIGVVTGAVSTATDIAAGGLSAIGNLVGGGGGEKSGTSVDDTDYCKMALGGGAVVRSAAKPAPASTSSTSSSSAPPPAEQQQPTSAVDKVDKKVDEIGKSIGGAIKGLFGN
jgi:hypothetical protein